MFDAHCHLDFDAYADDRAEVLARARAAGVRGIHVPGVHPEQWAGAAALSGEGIGSGVGIHPWWIARVGDLDGALASLTEAAGDAEAIGECGLDGPILRDGGPSMDEQVRVLEAHLDAARALSLPVVLHIVGAHGRALEVLQRHGPLAAGGMIHSYSGSVELIRPYAALGLSFSFGGVVTRDRARRPRAAVQAVPLDRLLLESDGPDQPLAERERSAPEDVAVTCAAVAQLRGEPLERIGEQTAENAARLFSRTP